MTPVPVRFSFSDFQRELTTLRTIVVGFVDTVADSIIQNLITQLEMIQRDKSDRTLSFEISQENPLQTIVSTNFEGSGRRARPVIGSISWKWMIKPVDNRKSKRSEFEITGLASTKLRILDASQPENELAMWRVELGDYQSPGCYFHTQVLGQSDVAPFPHSLSVPRLPTMLVTPMAAVEFLLCELFQDDWERHASSDRADLAFWNCIQKTRLKDLLSWKLSCIENCQGSPWVALKRAKPSASDGLFVGKRG